MKILCPVCNINFDNLLLVLFMKVYNFIKIKDVTGSFIVRGDLGVENVEIHSDNLAALTYDTVTATYSYDAASSTHQVH